MPILKFPNNGISGNSHVRSDAHDIDLSREELIAALREYETQFDDLVEGSLQGIMVTVGACPVFANQCLAAMFGYTVNEITELATWEDLVAPDDRQRVLDICKSRSTGKPAPAHYEYQARRKDGSIFWLENLSRQVTWHGESAVQSTVIDITEQKNFEADLIASKIKAEDANRAKSEFLATMTHEFRTPLNAIIGFSDLLRTKSFTPPNGRTFEEYADDIYSSGQHMLSLVNDVLDIAAIETGNREFKITPISLQPLLTEAIRTIGVVAEDKNIQVMLNVPERTPPIAADERACFQIFQNLLSNAVKFTEPEGTITVNAEVTPSALIVSVVDTGVGIPADKLASVTEPFTQVHQNPHLSANSTGLGLGIVKSLLDAHKGTMAIGSTVGEGTTVRVSFPR